MALSSKAWNALDALAVGEAKNYGPMATKVGGSRTMDLLVKAGHLEPVGPAGGRVSRTRQSIDAFNLFAVIPEDGTTLPNRKAREQAGLTQAAYDAAKKLLLLTGEIALARGRAGSVRREADLSARSGGVAREQELYVPFRRWLELQAQQSGEIYALHKAVGAGQEQARATGQWSKPDLVSVVVTDFGFLPGVDVTVSSFELKPLKHSGNLEGVYEASAHQRWCHYSSLVIEYPMDDTDEAPSVILAECQRFGVGLIRMWGDQAEPILAPERQSPAPTALSEMIDRVLTQEEQGEYLRAIGKDEAVTTGTEEEQA